MYSYNPNRVTPTAHRFIKWVKVRHPAAYAAATEFGWQHTPFATRQWLVNRWVNRGMV